MQLEDQLSQTHASDHKAKETIAIKESKIQSFIKEIARLKHVQNVSQQMQDWKSMMEESSKMASEMKVLVNVLHDDINGSVPKGNEKLRNETNKLNEALYNAD